MLNSYINTKTQKILAVTVVGTLLSMGASAQTMDIGNYIEQVQKNNPSYQAAKINEESAKLRNSQGSLIVLPQIEIGASQTVDEAPTSNVSFNGIKRETDKYGIAIKEKTPIGLSASLGYEQQRKKFIGASDTTVPIPEYYTGSPYIELSQSLWRNGFGSETRAERDKLNSAVEAQLYTSKASQDGIVTESKIAYFELYYSRKKLNAVQNSLNVSTKLKDWSYKRLKKELADESDYLQTKANNEIREIEFMTAAQEEKTAARKFNSLRGIEGDQVLDTLEEPKIPSFSRKPLSENNWRNDLRAAQKMADAAKAQTQLDKEMANPNLEVFGKYAWNSFEDSESSAQSEAFNNNDTAYTVGIRFSASLAAPLSTSVKQGYNKELVVSSLNFQRKVQEHERDYNDLVVRIESAQSKFKLSQLLEESQKNKVLNERKRQERGRTTLFQVLQFEQDYLASQLNKIKSEAELLTLLTQFELYNK